ncbi:Uncharacterised protein [Moraxella lacunata]|uniref:Uncharacterized protein n=1 Tax=Moraxella lacunata TaxID=477 RepID=A0A378T9G7_MORLA|nr:Uncharacterised protein [Moraxella lacunata]
MVACTQNIIENKDMLFNAKSIKKINKDVVVLVDGTLENWVMPSLVTP